MQQEERLPLATSPTLASGGWDVPGRLQSNSPRLSVEQTNTADEEEAAAAATATASVRPGGEPEEAFYFVRGNELVWVHLKSLLWKRFAHASSDLKFFMSVFVLPAALLTFALAIALLRPVTEMPAILLSPSLYGPNANSFIE